MKKAIFVFWGLLFWGCAEGDSITEDLNFEAPISSCNVASTFVFYKIAQNQILALRFASTTFLLTPQAVPDAPIEIALNDNSNTLVYRLLDRQIDGEQYFCSSIPTNTAAVVKEFVATDGTASVRYDLNPTPIGNSTVYTRSITLRNITFRGNGIQMRIETFDLGNDQVVINAVATTPK